MCHVEMLDRIAQGQDCGDVLLASADLDIRAADDPIIRARDAGLR